MQEGFKHCFRCEADVYPSQDMQANGRVLDVCPKCASAFGEAVKSSGESVAPRAEPAPTQPLSVSARAAPASLSPVDIVQLARGRLAAIETALANHDALLSEAAQLRRMVAAAEAFPTFSSGAAARSLEVS